MKTYFVEKTCQHRPVPGKPARYLERGTYYMAGDDEKVPEEYMSLIEQPAAEPPANPESKPDGRPVIQDIRSRKDVTDELDKLNVVYSKRQSVKDLEELLAAAKIKRQSEEQK